MAEPFFIDDRVRDSEIDVQGGVNNAKLMEYLQHGRHEYFRHRGLDAKQLILDRIDPVLREAHTKFFWFLGHGDGYRVTVVPIRAGLKIHFLSAIFRLPDLKLCLKSICTVVVSKDGELTRENLLGIDEGPHGRHFDPTWNDIPDKFEDY